MNSEPITANKPASPSAKTGGAGVVAPDLSGTQPQQQQVGGESLQARSIMESACRLARSAMRTVSRVLPWLSAASELAEEIEGAFARHFERQLEDQAALCLHCGSTRVNYCERGGLAGAGLDWSFEAGPKAGYLCADCGAFDGGVVRVELGEGV